MTSTYLKLHKTLAIKNFLYKRETEPSINFYSFVRVNRLSNNPAQSSSAAPAI